MNANQKQMVAEKINVGIVLKYFPIMSASERVRLALWLVEDARWQREKTANFTRQKNMLSEPRKNRYSYYNENIMRKACDNKLK